MFLDAFCVKVECRRCNRGCEGLESSGIEL